MSVSKEVMKHIPSPQRRVLRIAEEEWDYLRKNGCNYDNGDGKCPETGRECSYLTCPVFGGDTE